MPAPWRESMKASYVAAWTGLSRATPVGEGLELIARWMVWAAAFLTMTTPRIEVGPLHVTAGDILSVAASILWLAAWFFMRSKPLNLLGALWPTVILAAACASAVSSLDGRATAVGVVELFALWVLPGIVIPNVLATTTAVSVFLMCVSVGSLIA